MQDCAEGEQCNPTNMCAGGEGWTTTRCFPLDRDPAAIGEPCAVDESPYSGIESCGLDGFCWNVDPETLEGVCVALCTGSPETPICADPNTRCMVANDGDLPLCLPACNPVIQDCPEGESCHPIAFGGDFVCMPAGAPIETDQHPTMCEPGTTDVPSELLCDPDDEVCCAAFCNIEAPQCDAGLDCVEWYEPGVGLLLVGICILPR